MIIPAIDLIGGKCVRLYKGDFAQQTDYEISPVEAAKICANEGAQRLHIVDLDGAKKGTSEQASLIIEIAKETDLKVQTGGGIRELSQIQRLLDGGVSRVVIGSLSVTNPQMVKFWLSEMDPDRIVVALDVKIDDSGTPFPTTRGWTETSNETLWEKLDGYSNSGLKTVLVTDISKDGVLEGANVDLYAEIIKRYPDLDLITSGGVGRLKHVKSLKALKPEGIIIGKALFENRFTVAQAIKC